jgi:hypothetical protein
MDERDETEGSVPHYSTTFLRKKCQAAGGRGFLLNRLVARRTNSGVITRPSSELIQMSAR